MCQLGQLDVPPNACVLVLVGHEVRWEVRWEVAGGEDYNGLSAGQGGLQNTEQARVHGYVWDTHRPCPSRFSRVSSPLLRFTPHSAGQKSLQGFEVDHEILLCQS